MWTLRSNAAPKWHRSLLRLLDAAQVLHVTPQIAERYGQVRADSYEFSIDMFQFKLRHQGRETFDV